MTPQDIRLKCVPGSIHTFSSPHLVESLAVDLTLQNYGSLLRKDLDIPNQGHTLPRRETATDHRSISCAPNQSQYELSCHFLGSNVNLFHLTLTVFELPDELIISILSHISPDPRLTGNYAWFCAPYSRRVCDDHNQWAKFLRPLSMTCRAMRLRFLPWVQEHLVLWLYRSEEALVRKLNIVADASHADKFLASSVKYFPPFFPPVLGLIHLL